MLTSMNKVRNARIRQGMTQGELAKVAGCSLPTIWKAENDRHTTDLMKGKISKALGVDPDLLFADFGEQKNRRAAE